MNTVVIPPQPFISLDDIINYNPVTYQLTLTPDALNRLIALQVGVYGKSFVVCVDRRPVYWGAFWTMDSSVPFNGITIEQPLNSQTDTVTIQMGYPSSSFFTGVDWVDDAAIQESFQQVGKLISTPDALLPQSMKGYELYSWQQDNQWNYTLITGTDRDKTTQEIITANNTVTCRRLGQISTLPAWTPSKRFSPVFLTAILFPGFPVVPRTAPNSALPSLFHPPISSKQ